MASMIKQTNLEKLFWALGLWACAISFNAGSAEQIREVRGLEPVFGQSLGVSLPADAAKVAEKTTNRFTLISYRFKENGAAVKVTALSFKAKLGKGKAKERLEKTLWRFKGMCPGAKTSFEEPSELFGQFDEKESAAALIVCPAGSNKGGGAFLAIDNGAGSLSEVQAIVGSPLARAEMFALVSKLRVKLRMAGARVK